MSEKSIARNQRVSSVKVERSRELRKDMTEAEKVFWEMVRDRRMSGLKCRRQQIIDGFIVDFYCDSLGLCVEIDGGVHETEEQKNYDKLRDEALAIRSLKILRLKNEEVLGDKDSVYQSISQYIL
jgi:very-short-patch-repair endonuclease